MTPDWLDALESELPRAVEASERSIDRARVERAADAAIRAHAVKPRRVWRARRTWMLLAAAALVVGVAAAALEVRHLRAVQPAPPPLLPVITTVAQPAVATPVTTGAPAISIEDFPIAPVSTHFTPPVAADTAATLFSRANHARQDGKLDEAAALYRKLEGDFPTSNEAAVAHVSLGRILESQGNADGALGEFDRYLADPTRTDLREEALVGRARACNKLGRVEDEKHAWQALLRDHPDSMYASRARTRIQALE